MWRRRAVRGPTATIASPLVWRASPTIIAGGAAREPSPLQLPVRPSVTLPLRFPLAARSRNAPWGSEPRWASRRKETTALWAAPRKPSWAGAPPRSDLVAPMCTACWEEARRQRPLTTVWRLPAAGALRALWIAPRQCEG